MFLNDLAPSTRPKALRLCWLLTFLFVFGWVVISATEAEASDSDGIRPESAGAPLIWGRKDGILFGLPSDGGLPGPRGLIRVGVTSKDTGRPQLLNFIAVEPVIFGAGSRFSRMAFSELEFNTLDSASEVSACGLSPLRIIAEPYPRYGRHLRQSRGWNSASTWNDSQLMTRMFMSLHPLRAIIRTNSGCRFIRKTIARRSRN
jgi:hypothetical protein